MMRPVTFLEYGIPLKPIVKVRDLNNGESLIVDERTHLTSAEVVERKLQVALHRQTSDEFQSITSTSFLNASAETLLNRHFSHV